ncbi:hypothetical protein X737_38370 [Mesorhizobium sp. L48C026A00]|nr:hypothetical protein X737_38370 [Mesorhizobium sp. L48C026A00]
MRHVGRDIDEVAGTGFRDIFQVVAPAHARLALDHIDDAFQIAVVMRAGLGVGVDGHRAGPDLFGTRPRLADRRRPVHARRLGGVGVERIPRDDFYPILAPVDRRVIMIMLMMAAVVAVVFGQSRLVFLCPGHI